MSLVVVGYGMLGGRHVLAVGTAWAQLIGRPFLRFAKVPTRLADARG